MEAIISTYLVIGTLVALVADNRLMNDPRFNPIGFVVYMVSVIVLWPVFIAKSWAAWRRRTTNKGGGS